MELQERLADFDRAGVALFGLSYDSVEVLAGFAAKHGVTFPLLSDVGSVVIRQLGLYNEHLAEQARYYGREARPDQYGVPYPGIFYLDASGVVIAREFEQSYRVRPAPALLLDDLPIAATPGISQRVTRPGLTVTAAVDEASYRPYERHELSVSFAMDPGVHIYGAEVPSGFTALDVRIVPFDGIEIEPMQAPEPTPLRIAGIPDTFLVYAGQVTATVPFNIVPFLEAATLTVEVAYQACTDTMCYQPDLVRLELTLQGVDLIRD